MNTCPTVSVSQVGRSRCADTLTAGAFFLKGTGDGSRAGAKAVGRFVDTDLFAGAGAGLGGTYEVDEVGTDEGVVEGEGVAD